MLCERTAIEGAYVVGFEKIGDSRGYFGRVFSGADFREHGFAMEVSQANMSGNLLAGTLRGLHYQSAPYGEDKLVRAVAGSVFDVAADMRRDSPTYGRWHGVELSAGNWKAFFIPKGCAHGYYTLEDDSQVLYFVSAPYRPEAEGGIAWDDPVLGVKWPGAPRAISAKDSKWRPYDWRL